MYEVAKSITVNLSKKEQPIHICPDTAASSSDGKYTSLPIPVRFAGLPRRGRVGRPPSRTRVAVASPPRQLSESAGHHVTLGPSQGRLSRPGPQSQQTAVTARQLSGGRRGRGRSGRRANARYGDPIQHWTESGRSDGSQVWGEHRYRPPRCP